MSTLKIKKVNQGNSEKDIEQFLCREIKKLGGEPYKFSSPGRRHVPDRLCALPESIIIFVECKRPGESPSPAQRLEISKLHKLKHLATCVSTKDEVRSLIHELKAILEIAKEQL